MVFGHNKADNTAYEFTSRFGEVIHHMASTTFSLEKITKEEFDAQFPSFTENLISFVFTQIKGV